MRAVNNYVVVQDIKEEPKKIGGLILTEELDDDNRYIKASVVSVGNLVEGINTGETVYYDKHAGNGVQHEDTLYKVIRSMDIVLIED